jgi:hypothetical protein
MREARGPSCTCSAPVRCSAPELGPHPFAGAGAHLLRAQLGILFSAVFFSVITGRSMRDGHWFIHIASWWLRKPP